ncbi:autophagy protein 17 [Ascosphaera pollenicola]|nr:autophagy protein 17 [Ascosphaera pollenicola]
MDLSPPDASQTHSTDTHAQGSYRSDQRLNLSAMDFRNRYAIDIKQHHQRLDDVMQTESPSRGRKDNSTKHSISLSSTMQQQQQQQLDVSSSSQPIPLDILIRHLLHAKRHLSSIAQLYRAQHIVQLARQSLQDSVIVSARTTFLRRGLNEQLSLLYAVRDQVEGVLSQGQKELRSTVAELDSADELVKKAVEELGNMQVEKGFLMGRDGDGDGIGVGGGVVHHSEQGLTLRDFIEESGVQGLHADLKDAIDNVTASQQAFASSNETFDAELKAIRKQLARHRQVVIKACGSVSSSSTTSSTSSTSSRITKPTPTTTITSNDNGNGPSLAVLPDLLRSLESRGEYLAGLLQSLVRHYDLCVSALRHTEGGWAAARSILGDLPANIDFNGHTHPIPAVSHPPDDENRVSADHRPKSQQQQLQHDGGPPNDLEPMSMEEYHQLLQVIDHDAPVAADVACEISEYLAEMENTFTQVFEGRDAFISVYASTLKVCRGIERLINAPDAGVQSYIQQARNFEDVWACEREKLDEGIMSLVGLREMYVSFLEAYDRCIMEAARRESVWKNVERVLKGARAELDKIYAADEIERRRVREEVAMYLPVGVWNDFGRGMGRVEFLRTEGDHLDDGGIGSEEAPADEEIGGNAATPKAERAPFMNVETAQRRYQGLLAPESVEDRSMPILSRDTIAEATRRIHLRNSQRKHHM